MGKWFACTTVYIAGLLGLLVVLILFGMSIDMDRFIQQCRADGGTQTSCEVQYNAMLNGRSVVVEH